MITAADGGGGTERVAAAYMVRMMAPLALPHSVILQEGVVCAAGSDFKSDLSCVDGSGTAVQFYFALGGEYLLYRVFLLGKEWDERETRQQPTTAGTAGCLAVA